MRALNIFLAVRLTFFVFVALLFSACDNKVHYEVKEPGAASKPAPPSKPQPSSRNGSFYSVEYTPNPTLNLPPITEVSIVSQQTVIARLAELTPGKLYTLEWRCTDGAGKEVGVIGALDFTPTDVTHALACSTVEGPLPNHTIYQPGRWHWTLDVSKHGRFATEIDVHPASLIERTNLARYEMARESVLLAMKHYWQGLDDGTFHTVIGFKKREEPKVMVLRSEIAEANKREQEFRASLATLTNRPGFRQEAMYAGTKASGELRVAKTRLAELTKEREALERQLPRSSPVKVPDDFLGYIQVGGMDNVDAAFSKTGISEADGLNGITYRGGASFTFTVFRFLKDEGWTDWQDCQRYSARFLEAFGRWSRIAPSALQNKLHLDFTIMERDGNWFVTTPGGDQFVNGNLTKAVSDWVNEKPTKQYAQGLVNGTNSFTRDSYRAMGEAARNNPTALEQSDIETMNLLRGRRLMK